MRHQHRKAAPIRPQWRGTEEVETMTQAELDRIMAPFRDGSRNILDCMESAPEVLPAFRAED